MRKKLLKQVVSFGGTNEELSTLQRIKLSALLRLYCGLMGLMKLRLNSQEMHSIIDVIMKSKHER
jgi:hypothetical protein